MAEKLYEIPGRYEHFYQTMMDEGVGLTPEVVMVLDAIDEDFKGKIQNVCKVVAELRGHQEMASNESRRLASKAKAYENKVKWLKEYMLENMDRMDIDKVEGLFRVTVANNPPSVAIVDNDLVPSEFDVEKDRQISKSAIKDALLSGREVPGAELVRKQGLRIT